MKQLSLFDLFDEQQSQSTAEKAGLVEKQSNLSSNITASNNASEVEPSKAEVKHISPLMQQWCEIKAKYPTALLLFRVGDFYEAYNDDAKDACKILGITLCKRGKADFEFCGFPFHALDTYLPKLVRAGRRVAICDQLEDVKQNTKNLVKRPTIQFSQL